MKEDGVEEGGREGGGGGVFAILKARRYSCFLRSLCFFLLLLAGSLSPFLTVTSHCTQDYWPLAALGLGPDSGVQWAGLSAITGT